MKNSYQSGDVYLAFAKLAGAVPPEAAKDTHPRERDLFKKVILGAQYCVGVTRLVPRLGVTLPEARDLLEQHRHVFCPYWSWLDAVGDYGQLQGKIPATLGWTLHVTAATSLGTLRHFPMQANASEMLQLASIFVHHAGVSIVGLVHDALLLKRQRCRACGGRSRIRHAAGKRTRAGWVSIADRDKNHSLPELFSREARSNHMGVDHGDVAVDREIRGGVNPG